MQKVSVIMPCFNHARFLPDSVISILRQTHADLELIIIDDCSSDNSWQVMSRFAVDDPRIKVIRHERNQGLPKSRNDALRMAKGAFIAFCDSDDVWESDKLEVQLDLLRKNPDYDVVYCDTLIINETGLLTGQRFSEVFPLPKSPSGWLFRDLVRANFINVQSALMRKHCLESVNHFDEDLGALEDWWYWVQLSLDHRFLYFQQPLARYRVHNQSMNAMNRRSFPVNRFKIFRRMLRKYPGLSARAKADINYQMGVDLCTLGKCRSARHFLFNAVRLSTTDVRAFQGFWKAWARILFLAFTRQMESFET
jgi:glycosyltransferase involved in cell wall biosynthesis